MIIDIIVLKDLNDQLTNVSQPKWSIMVIIHLIVVEHLNTQLNLVSRLKELFIVFIPIIQTLTNTLFLVFIIVRLVTNITTTVFTLETLGNRFGDAKLKKNPITNYKGPYNAWVRRN